MNELENVQISNQSREFGRLVEEVFKEIECSLRTDSSVEVRESFSRLVENINRYSSQNLMSGLSDLRFGLYSGLLTVLQDYVEKIYKLKKVQEAQK